MESMVWDRMSLNKSIHAIHSCLCVGLDSDRSKLPGRYCNAADGVFEFNKAIIDVTLPYAVSYKLNAAFYEVNGADGWGAMKDTIAYLKEKNKFIILDAKRGDIGNTGLMYAKACFDTLGADAATVSPYMGKDSVDSFLSYSRKWTILLALTSNPGSQDFQLEKLESGRLLFEEVVLKAKSWGSHNQLMFVTGATKTDYFRKIREHVPDYFLLIPGIGAQGGDLGSVMEMALTTHGDILINASRSILFASSGPDFVQAAEKEAIGLQKKMAEFI